MPDAKRSVVVVSGMHRAGTSVVARGLQALGLDLGDALMSADVKMNARGFFEDVDVVKLDDALLDARGADWKNVALLDGVDWRAPAHAAHRDAARRMLDAKLARSGSFAFKDPRVPRLLPFWQAVFADARITDAYVIAVRHPRAVVDSLTARDDLDARRSGWLWLIHLACSLAYASGRPRVVVDYDRMLAAPERELARIARALGLPADAVRRPEVAVYAREFLTDDLRHARYDAADAAAADVVPGTAAAHALAQRLAGDDADPDAPDVQQEVAALFAGLRAQSPLLAYAGSVERAADEVPRLTGELAWARSAIAAAATYNEDLLATVHTKDVYQKDLSAHLARKEGELVAAHSLIERMRERLVGRLLLRGLERKE
ncbi:MAG: hypothetical protein U1F15_01735 [Burkholderiales bacterium]